MSAATPSIFLQQPLRRLPKRRSTGGDHQPIPPDQRQQQRQLRSGPIAAALVAWPEDTMPKRSRKSEFAVAFRYMRARWTALTRCLEDGRLGLDENSAERTLRGVAIGRNNYLFAGSDAGGRRAAAMDSSQSAKRNGVTRRSISPTSSRGAN
jgi:transposase